MTISSGDAAKTRVLALLDKPSPKSFGIVPLVTERHGVLRISGLADESSNRARAVTAPQIESLIASGHALRVDKGAGFDSDIEGYDAALWAGDVFRAQATHLHVPPPPLPLRAMRAPGGAFYVAAASELFPYLEKWVDRSLSTFLASGEREEKRQIADLMHWTLPSHPKTMAAVWSIAPDPDRELQWQAHTSSSRGASPKELNEQHVSTLRDHADPFYGLCVVAFTGGTGTRRQHVAERFSQLSKAPLTSFVTPLLRKIGGGVEEPDRKERLMEVGQQAVERSPLDLTLQALSVEQLGKIVVLDSVRHNAIHEVLQWMRPKKLFLVAVGAEEQVRRKRLIARGLDPDEVLKDPTERDIPELVAAAYKRINGEVADPPELRELLQELNP